jgi:hypothetical protein
MATTWSTRLAGLAVVLAVVAVPTAAWLLLPPAPHAEAAPLNPSPGEPPFVVHEWGTFLSVQGSDGTTLGGMVDSEEELPAFVRERGLDGRARSAVFAKMETPVTYFYVDKPMKVRVRVDMPLGLLTHWFPGVLSFGPPAKAPRDSFGKLPPSFLEWGTLELIPDKPEVREEMTKALKRAHGTWPFARQTDAAFVKVTGRKGGLNPDEVEKFLFYRGLGTMDLPLHVFPHAEKDSGQKGRVVLENNGSEALRNVFVIRVAGGRIGFAALDDLAGKGRKMAQTPEAELKLDEGVPLAKKAVAAGLVKAGLFPKEAEAMVNTWEKSYFRSDGLRVLYVLPRSFTDAAIPIRIEPKPDVLERVMVGRVEVLTEEAEQAALKAVKTIASRDADAAQAARDELARLGRLEEPVLRRVLALTDDKAVLGCINARLEELKARSE